LWDKAENSTLRIFADNGFRRMNRTLFAVSLWVLSGLALAAPSQEAVRYYEEALSYFNQEQYESAVIQLKNALQINSDYLPARLLLGEALLLQGDGAAAEKEIRIAQRTGAAPSLTLLPLAKALDQQRKFADLVKEIRSEQLPPDKQQHILFLRGKAFLELGEYTNAKRAFKRALDTPGSSKVLPTVGLAMLALREQQPQQADQIADQALTLDPEHPEVWHAKGAIAYARGDLEQAVSHYTRCLQLNPGHYTAKVSRASVYVELERYKEAIKEFDELSVAAEWDPQINYYLALAKRKTGDLQGAKDALRKAAQIVNSASYEKLRESRQLLLIGGLINYSNGELEKARQFLSDYISQDRNNVVALKLQASTLLAMQEPAKAIPFLKRATELAPKEAALHRQLAEAYFRVGQYGKAIWSYKTADRLAPGEPQTLFKLGVSHLAAKDRKAAIKKLEAAYQADPKSAQIALMLSSVHLGNDNVPRAKEILERLTQSQPQNPTAANMLATAYLQAGDRRRARQWYGKALTINPDFRPAIINLAQLDALEKRYDSARAALDRLLAKEPENQRLLYELATLEKQSGSLPNALRLLEKAYEFDRDAAYVAFRLIDYSLVAGNNDRAFEVASDLRRQDAENPRVYLAMGRVELAKGDTAAAQAAFQKAVKLAGFDAQTLYEIAEWQLRAGNPEEARWSLQKAVKGDGAFVPAMLALVELEIGTNKLDSAEKLIKKFAARHRNHPAVNRLRGDLAFRKGDYGQAIGYYDAALKQKDDPDLVLRRFQARTTAGEKERAVSEMAAWVEANPRNLAARQALAETYHAQGQQQQAKTHYEELLQQGLESAELLNNMANLYADMGDPRALDFAQKAYKLSPTNPSIIDTLGWLLVKGGKLEKGLGHLRDASARSPNQAEIRYHLAVALEGLGRLSDALQELRAALRLSEEFPGSEDARKRLATLEKQVQSQ
jgi:putative PEP-CTERM system TPR-repeat lipoprotein